MRKGKELFLYALLLKMHLACKSIINQNIVFTFKQIRSVTFQTWISKNYFI